MKKEAITRFIISAVIIIILCFSVMSVAASGVELADGKYTVNISLYHSEEDKESMAASAIGGEATIVVANGEKTMHITCGEMSMGPITASLQELRVADINGEFTDAVVETVDANGNPTGFFFTLPHTNEYIDVKVNPHLAMLGNKDIGARIKVDYSSLKKVEEATTIPQTDVAVSVSETENIISVTNEVVTEYQADFETEAVSSIVTQSIIAQNGNFTNTTQSINTVVESVTEIEENSDEEKKAFPKWIFLLLIPILITVIAVTVESRADKKEKRKN